MLFKNEIILRFADAGILRAILWAYHSASNSTLSEYSADSGYDATWVGMTRFMLFRDRLDRVFSCGQYAVPEDEFGCAACRAT